MSEYMAWPSAATNFVSRKNAQKVDKNGFKEIRLLPILVLRLLCLFAAIQTR
jgi:hypothetical protein